MCPIYFVKYLNFLDIYWNYKICKFLWSWEWVDSWVDELVVCVKTFSSEEFVSVEAHQLTGRNWDGSTPLTPAGYLCSVVFLLKGSKAEVNKRFFICSS